MDRLAAITVNITDRGVDFLKEEIDLKEKLLILNHVFKFLFIFHQNFLCFFLQFLFLFFIFCQTISSWATPNFSANTQHTGIKQCTY